MCLSQLESAKLRCLKCLRKNPAGFYCPSCFDRNKPDAVLALFKYDGQAKELIHQFKFEDFTDLKEPLAEAVANLIAKSIKYKDFVLQPIPLDRKRLLVRGYNQSQLICDKVGKILDIEVCDYLKKEKTKKHQFEIVDKVKRRRNIKNAFSVKVKKVKQKIILIDDVITSGATCEEATKTLKKQGANEVYVFALAMG